MSESLQQNISNQSSSDLELFQSYLDEGIGLDLEMPNRGDLREGTIVEIRANELLVNVGSKRDGVVPQSDLSRLIRSLSKACTKDKKSMLSLPKRSLMMASSS